MTTDTIKHLGAEFHRAADSLADTLARLDNARLERLTFLRRCSKDSTARLAALKEEIRTLLEQIAKWDAEAARLESQTAEDLLRQALDARKCDGDHIGPLCADRQCWLRDPEEAEAEKPEPYRAGLPPERLRKVWAEWESKGGTVYAFKGDRYQCDCWLDGAEVPIAQHAKDWPLHQFRPHGATWSRVEAMADEAEKAKCPACGKKPDRDTLSLSAGEYVSCEVCGHYLHVVDSAWQIVRPVENCGHVAADGTCGHPNALTPECHDGVVCPVKAGKPAEKYACDFCRDGRRFMVAVDAVNSDGTVTNSRPAPCLVCGRTERAQENPAFAPTLLDLTKLPPGTVCEATKFFGIYNSGIMLNAGDRFRVVGQADGDLPVLIEVGGKDWWLSALVPARVVKEGGEDAPR